MFSLHVLLSDFFLFFGGGDPVTLFIYLFDIHFAMNSASKKKGTLSSFLMKFCYSRIETMAFVKHISLDIVFSTFEISINIRLVDWATIAFVIAGSCQIAYV